MQLTRIHLAVAAAAAFGAGVAAAEDAVPSAASVVPNTANVVGGSAFEAGGVPVGAQRAPRAIRLTDGVNLYAQAGLDVGHDSNVTQAARGREVSSDFFRVRPTLTAESRYRADVYQLSYKGDYVRYPSYDPNSVMQNDLIFGAVNSFTTRSSLAWGASAGDHYDPVGSTDRNQNSSEADHYRSWAANATYRYGADDAKGRIEVDGGYGSKRYQNNRAFTQSADVNNVNLASRFYYRVAPKTRAVAELRRTTYDYVTDISQLENTDYRLYAGAIWDATSAISGTVKLGQQFKDYKHDDVNPDYKGFSWEGAVRWKPLTYSSFDLLSGRSANDPSGAGSGVPVTRNATLAWNHDWTSFVHTRVSAGRQYVRYSVSGRKDIQDSVSASLMYDMRRWLGIGVEYAWSRRDSNVDSNDYTRNVAALKLEASF